MVSAMDQDYVILASKIKKLQEIAKGGFGVVYKGLMQGKNEIAIKELYNQNLSEAAKQDLEQELAISKKMHHPNIVLLYGYCRQPLCLVMEYLPMNLFQLLHNKKELSWDLRYNISFDIVLGLDHIHEKKIIHRDLKSNNILLDQNLRAKITDFGLSRVRTESNSLESTSQVGNNRWKAPELMNAKPKYSKQSDIFALGVIFWEIAARKVPFQDADDLSIREDIKAGEREDMPEDCPSNYQKFIEKCWQQSPSDRASLEFLQNSLEKLVQQSQPQIPINEPEIENVQSGFGNLKIKGTQEENKIETLNVVKKMYQINYDKSQGNNYFNILDKVFSGHTESICSLAVSPDNKYIISGSASPESAIKLHSFQDGTLLRTLTGHSSYINSVVISSDMK